MFVKLRYLRVIIGHSGNQELAVRRHVFAILLFTALPVWAAEVPHLVLTNPATEVKISIAGRQLHYKTLIESNDEAKDVRVVVTQFAGPQQITPACTVDAAPCETPFTIGKLSSKALSIEADGFDSAGVYTAILSIISAAGRQSLTMSVTRSAPPALAVRIVSMAKVEQTTSDELSLRVLLQETGGAPHSLNPPEIADIATESPGKGRVAANITGVRSFDGCTELKGPWTLSAGGLKAIQVDLLGLTDPGEYKALVRFPSPDGQSVEQTVTIDLRRSGLIAALFIALGVGISALLHAIVTLRPWLVQNRMATSLDTDLKNAVRKLNPVDGEVGVVGAIRDQLEGVARKLSAGERVADADETLAEVDRKLNVLPKWIAASRRVNAMPQPVPAEISQTVDNSATDLLSAGFDQTKETSVSNELNKLGPKIDAALAADLKARIAAMQVVAQSSASLTSQKAKDLLASDVIPKLNEAAKSIGTEPLTVAASQYAEAQTGYAKVLAQEVTEALAQPPMTASSAAKWEEAKVAVEPFLQTVAQKKGDEALKAARIAFAIFVDAAAASLQKWAAEENAVIDAGAASTGVKAALKARIGEVEAAAAKAQQHAVDGAIDLAASTYANALALYKKFAVEKTNAQMGAAGAEPAAVPAAVDLSAFPISVAHDVISIFRTTPPTPAFWSRLVNGIDAIIIVIALALAVGLGLKLLWDGNSTWGSFSDCLVAILWGLGLHQVSGNAFEGIPALIAKFR
jgi:hypothetical protein